MCETLYISDLDGTLLNREDKISEFTARAVNSLVEQGVRFTYATARSFPSAQKVSAGLVNHLPVIVYNGAFIIDGATGEKLLESGFSPEQKDFVREAGEKLELSPLVYAFVDGEERVSWRTDRENEGLTYYIGNRKGDRRLRPVWETEPLYRGDAFYFTFIGTREELFPLWEQLRECPWMNVTFQRELYRTEFWLELMPRCATKAQAARELKRLLGCEKLVVFGDAVNDLPLFEAADECYAVENAVTELKAAATAVIRSNEEDGVARWLLEHVKPGQAGKPAEEERRRPRPFRLRPYESRDLEELIRLFYETVHTVNLGDYTQEEVNAWAPSAESVDREAWGASLLSHFTLVAEAENGALLGFADLDGDYFDRLYVQKEVQGKGVASALADALERQAWSGGAEQLEVHASVTARPFFEKRGYRPEREQRVSRNGVSLKNFILKKERPRPGGAGRKA